MKRIRLAVSLVVCFILIAALSVTAYALGLRSIGTTLFHSTTSTSYITRLGQFESGEILWEQQGVYDIEHMLWWYGYPDSNTGIYNYYGYAIPGYSRDLDDDGNDNFSFILNP